MNCQSDHHAYLCGLTIYLCGTTLPAALSKDSIGVGPMYGTIGRTRVLLLRTEFPVGLWVVAYVILAVGAAVVILFT